MDAHVGPGNADLRQSGAHRHLPRNEGRTPCGARLFCVAVRKPHPVFRKAVSTISTVIELLNDSDDCAYTVPELSEMVGVSQRSLLSVFRDQLGVSPQDYLISHRLYRARQSLLSASSADMTVGAVAVQCGFFDFGRFARRYCHLFGELPSATLRRRAK